MKTAFAEQPTEFETLLEEHRKRPDFLAAYRLHFLGAEGHDVYNISQTFAWKGKTYLCGRVERRTSPHSYLRVFEQIGETTYLATPIAFPRMEDPCVGVIDHELVIGGTEIVLDSHDEIASWHTAFLKGPDLETLKKVVVAPDKMKDVRLVQTDKIHVFTRPQGGIARGGRIGYVCVPTLGDVTTDLIKNATLLTTQFTDPCWGGVNQVHVLQNGLLGIVGHIAKMSEGDVRHYCGMVFAFDPKTQKSTPVKIICERADFPEGPAKRPDLVDVVFLGGLHRNKDGTATLYTGLSDAEAYAATIKDPFLDYEK